MTSHADPAAASGIGGIGLRQLMMMGGLSCAEISDEDDPSVSGSLHDIAAAVAAAEASQSPPRAPAAASPLAAASPPAPAAASPPAPAAASPPPASPPAPAPASPPPAVPPAVPSTPAPPAAPAQAQTPMTALATPGATTPGTMGKSSAAMAAVLGLGTLSCANICMDDWVCPHCDNSGEGETPGEPIPVSEQEDHLKRRCPERDVICAACSKGMKAKDRKQHASQCTGPVVACQKCGAKVRRVYADNHKRRCVPFGSVGSLHLRVTQELQITDLMAGGAAELAGLKPGDVILKVTNPVGEFAIATREDFQKAVGPRSHVFEGTEITLHVLRGTDSIRRWKGSFSSSVIKRRETLQSFCESQVAHEIKVKLGPETVAARDVRRRRLELFKKVFPDMNLENVDDFISDPDTCNRETLEAFTKADKDGGGVLSCHEMYDVFLQIAERCGVEPPSLVDCRDAFEEVDVDGNGVITYSEFFPYIRSLFLATFWGEGPSQRCTMCGLRVRERHRHAHERICLGRGYPRGSLQCTVAKTGACKVTAVRQGGIAQQQGVRVGDVITHIATGSGTSRAVANRAQLLQRLAPSAGACAGQRVVLTVQSSDGENEIEVLLAQMDPARVREAVQRMERALQQSPELKRANMTLAASLLTCDEQSRTSLRAHFEANDTDGNGFLTRKEIRHAMKAVAQELRVMPTSDAGVDDLFAKLGAGEDAKLTFTEFLPLLRRRFLSQLGALDGASDDSLDA